jgi:hypothetical protein
MTHPIGVGIVGAGRISDLHAIEYLRGDDARIVAVCDRAAELAAAKAAAWGCRRRGCSMALEDLLACDEVDLVEVLLPHDLHLPADAGRTGGGQGGLGAEADGDQPRRRHGDGGGGRGRAVPQGVRKLRVSTPPVQKAKGVAGRRGDWRAADDPDQERVR